MDWYRQSFKEFESLQLLVEKEERKSAWHLCVGILKSDLRDYRKAIFYKLREIGIGVQVHYIPVYYHPYYKKLGYRKGLCPRAESYYERCLSLPLFPEMTDSEFEKTVSTVKWVIGNCMSL